MIADPDYNLGSDQRRMKVTPLPGTAQEGWDRTRLDGTEGARTWTGHGILAHNLVKIGVLAA